ncbi:MAG: hypothetical protein FJ144_11475 [Deltaproteobacteria bacterium]|nr:hypothetical protein [Deltaproteobacteria bacterium]
METDERGSAAPEFDLGRLLTEHGLLDDEAPGIELAGDGNINWVWRVRSRRSGRSVVVKHARPALARFPQYETSTERIVFEHRWFEIAQRVDPANVCPAILHFDEKRRLLVLEDLGGAERLDAALLRGAPVEGVAAAEAVEGLEAGLVTLADFLGRVHAATRDDASLNARFRNDDIRRLHGDHIFVLPYAENDFPLADEVARRASELRREGRVGEIAARAYERYLEPQGALVHGDVQAGNVLLAPGGPKLLDAEIAHVGDPAFDVGTLLAHDWLGALATGRDGASIAARAARVWDAHRASSSGGSAGEAVGFADVARYAGLEMMRRTIGAARVAAVESVAASLAAIRAAERLVLDPPDDPRKVALA